MTAHSGNSRSVSRSGHSQAATALAALENVCESARIRCYIHKPVYNLALFLIDALYVSVPVARPCLLRLHRGYSCGNVTNLSRLIIYTNSLELASARLCSPPSPLSLSIPLTDHRSPPRVRLRLRSFLAQTHRPYLYLVNDATHVVYSSRSHLHSVSEGN